MKKTRVGESGATAGLPSSVFRGNRGTAGQASSGTRLFQQAANSVLLTYQPVEKVEGRGQVQVFGHRPAVKDVVSPKIGPDPDFFNRLLRLVYHHERSLRIFGPYPIRRLNEIPMRFTLKETRLGLRNSRTRIPFRYGGACLTRCPQAVLAATIETTRGVCTGYSGDCLPPLWFDKTPGRGFREQIADMCAAIRLAGRDQFPGP